MSQNNSSDTAAPICQYPQWFWTAGDILQWTGMNVVVPVFLTVGILGHLICYRAFVNQAKNEKAYNYQIYLILAEIGEIVAFSLFMITYQWSGINTLELGSIDGSPWFQRLYFPMFFAAHMGIPLCNAMSVVCLLLSVSMAADRIFAFVKPFVYKNIKHKWHQRTALACSLLIGFSVTFYNVFLFEVDASQYPYQIAPNIPYLITTLALGLAYLCNATRLIGLAILISCNIALIHLFKRRLTNVGQMNRGGGQDAKREAHKKANERTLILLTLCQSFFTGISMCSYAVFYAAAYTVPTFNFCEHRLFAPILDLAVMLSDIGNTITTVMINKKTRNLVLSYVRFYKTWKLVKVEPIGTVAGSTNIPSAHTGHGQSEAGALGKPQQINESHVIT